MVIGAVALLAAFWFLALSPERKNATAINTKIVAAQERRDTARQQAAAASAARARYDVDYATVAKLGKAVPADDDVASLVYQLNHVSTGNGIDFRSIKLTSSGAAAPAAAPAAAQAAALASSQDSKPASGSSSESKDSSSTTSTTPATGVPGTQAAAAGLPPGSTVGSAGFPTMPFEFVFDGSFFDMERFFNGVQHFAAIGDNSSLSVRGRLLTVDAFSLSASRSGFPKVKAAINATAYLVPEGEGLTGGATPQGPAASGGSTPAASGSPAAPAAATSIAGGAR